MNRRLGNVSFAGALLPEASAASSFDMPSACDDRRAPVLDMLGVGPKALAVLLLVMPALVLGSDSANSDEDVGLSESRLRPLLPCTEGNHPFSPFCIVEDA